MKNEIICPHCNKAFKIDDTAFAEIQKQVRDNEFNAELHARLEDAVKLAVAETKNDANDDVAKKDAEIARLRAEKEVETTKLQAKLDVAESDKKLAVTEAVNHIEKNRDELAGELRNKENEQKILENSLKEKYETQIKDRDDTIERLKDMKAKLSVKLVGETLEQHCQNEFDAIRATAFPFAYFEKDNEISDGTKGDYVYRDHDQPNGTEYISIMFEMKNEQDDSSNKKTNDSFLKKLDEDRKKKGCEYAVLVTLLEAENELYNRGIVDVSHKHEKMYVIRPQFFIPMITLLRNTAINSLESKAELALVRSQNIDITTFENDLEVFKLGFARNYDLASRKFTAAIDDIDKTIKLLERTKSELLSSDNNLRLANNKIHDVTIKRLTHNNPTMAEKFANLGKDQS